MQENAHGFNRWQLGLVIRHDPWVITFPQVYGTITFFISPTEQSSTLESDLNNQEVPRFNVLDAIDELPVGLKKTLTNDELRDILYRFCAGYEGMSALRKVEDVQMVKEVQSDIEAAIQHVTHRLPHYGQSKWCSLQGAEKLLKAYLAHRGKQFPKHHKLAELADLAEDAGLSPINRSCLGSIQCSASIRYGEGLTSLADAFLAHWSTVIVCRHVAREMDRKT